MPSAAYGRFRATAALKLTTKKGMTIMRKTILTAFAALSLGAAAIGAQAQNAAPATSAAQPQDQAPQHQGRFGHGKNLTPEQRAQFKAKRAEMRAKRIAALHDELRITPAQEAAWKSFVASMQPAQAGLHGKADRAAMAGLTAPERMSRAIARQKQRTVAMEQRLGALNSFYSVLTPEQKQTFDAKAARMQQRFHHGRRGMDGQQRGDTAQG